jgi:hypothetical protein
LHGPRLRSRTRAQQAYGTDAASQPATLHLALNARVPEGDRFCLRNCGYFNETGKPGEVFTRQSTAAQKPEIDFDKLPCG